MDIIRIDRLELDCIVGIRPQERERPQRVRLDIALHVDTSQAGKSGRIALTCDYAEVAEQVISMLNFRHYQLIEMATEELSAMLLGTHPSVQAVQLRLEKPGALEGRARAASVEVMRTRDNVETRRLTTSGLIRDVLLTTREASLCLLQLDPGASLARELRSPYELMWLLSGEAKLGNRALVPFSPLLANPGAGTLQNSGSDPATLFYCGSPPPVD